MCKWKDCIYRAVNATASMVSCDRALRTGKSRLKEIAEREGVDPRALARDPELRKKMSWKACPFYTPRNGTKLRVRITLADTAPYRYEEKPKKRKKKRDASRSALKLDEAKARTLYDRGLNDRQIAEELGNIRRQTVQKWRKRNELPTQKERTQEGR